MKGIHWIDLGQWPPALAVVSDKRAYQKFMLKHCDTKVNDFPPRNGGLCRKMVDGTDCIFLIVVGPQSDPINLACTLAHEATHAMRWIFEQIEEREPGVEAQAYLVEHILRGGLNALAK